MQPSELTRRRRLLLQRLGMEAAAMLATTVSNQLDPAVETYLLGAAARERPWLADQIRPLLGRSSLFVSVRDVGRVVGAVQILFERPYLVEEMFPGCLAQDARVPCEVTLLAVERSYRRSPARGRVRVLDALVKTLYLCCRGRAVTHVCALADERLIGVLERDVGLAVKTIGKGLRYRCGTETHDHTCTLPVACVIDVWESERRWRSERPSFWAYVGR